MIPKILGVEMSFFASLKSDVDVMHICFSYSDGFRDEVCLYQKAIKPRYTVIHATVPVGTSEALNCHHSPIRGTHPGLAESMKTFVTYLAPPNMFLQQYFKQADIHVMPMSDPKITEAGKLWSLAAYAWNILLEKEIHRYCQEYGISFDAVYKHFTYTYNEGYHKMGRHNVQRPVLDHIEGPIGGHCIIQGVEKLESKLTDIILDMQAELTLGNS